MRVSKLRKLGRKITPDDLRNPKVASGYDYVSSASPSANSIGRSAGTGQHWRAIAYNSLESSRKDGRSWWGSCRSTAKQAAQDFCDYFNGDQSSVPAVLTTAGHEYEVDERDTDPEYQAALGVMRDRKAQRAGKQGYVYLIVETTPEGRADLSAGKVGYSTNPRKRVAEGQTFNKRPLRLLCMKPGTEADERALHQKYINLNILQEWFHLTRELLLEWDAEHHIPREAA